MRRLLLVLLLALATPLWAAEPRDLAWTEMIPEGTPPVPEPQAPMHESQGNDGLADESAPPAAQASPSAPVVKALDGQLVRLPGYLVPLETASDGRVREFLLVPFFGACIHVPPPPSNQIVHVRNEPGVQLEVLYQPYWVEGRLQVEQTSSELAEAGYRMITSKVYPYEMEQ
ncbi:DUF3299 domain-containing protein [Azotobacter chroococcum]|uniref:DUF3299 domain-containing protein n=1 Tax=Azotobacter chroococcum TaxID=353 RepID=A0AA43Z2J5_9GAMM|nr:DUF3299 domain-containing protein [Azotobacter chroococcum]NHN75734.1 DUF3299 domain-containing protein [Azotobacter chroococcum]